MITFISELNNQQEYISILANELFDSDKSTINDEKKFTQEFNKIDINNVITKLRSISDDNMTYCIPKIASIGNILACPSSNANTMYAVKLFDLAQGLINSIGDKFLNSDDYLNFVYQCYFALKNDLFKSAFFGQLISLISTENSKNNKYLNINNDRKNFISMIIQDYLKLKVSLLDKTHLSKTFQFMVENANNSTNVFVCQKYTFMLKNDAKNLVNSVEINNLMKNDSHYLKILFLNFAYISNSNLVNLNLKDIFNKIKNLGNEKSSADFTNELQIIKLIEENKVAELLDYNNNSNNHLNSNMGVTYYKYLILFFNLHKHNKAIFSFVELKDILKVSFI